MLVAGVAVLALVGGGMFLATRGQDSGGLIGGLIGDDDERPVPEVTLQVESAKYEATSKDADPARQEATAEDVSEDVAAALGTMLRTAYVDPDTWDDPGAVAEAFSGDAADRIESEAAVMTLGEGAGDVYEYVDPGKATVTVRVLTGSKGEALRVSAQVTFPGLTEHDDGTYTKLVISGSYLLIEDGGAWMIDSFRVDRQEKPAEAPATPSASATATEGGTG